MLSTIQGAQSPELGSDHIICLTLNRALQFAI